MPKKISKSVIQNVKQSVNINIPVPKRRRTRSTKRSMPMINTGTMLSSTIIPAGYTQQIGRTISEPIPQSHHRLGRLERTMDDLLAFVDRSRFISSDPKPIIRPIDEPVAYDSGFINRSETPMNFSENSIRRMPRNMQDIPVPTQGMFGNDPMLRIVQEEMNQVNNDLNRRLLEASIGKGGGGGEPRFSDSQIKAALAYNSLTPVKSEKKPSLQQQEEINAMMYADAGVPPPSPYEQAEFK
jgi:hypothetical protein